MKTSFLLLASGLLCVALPLHAGEAGRKAPFDANQDGIVSTAEVAQHKANRFMKMDVDGDGAVSRDDIAEFKARLREQRTGSRADRFELADSNGDGLVGQDEARAFAQTRAQKLDADGDGAISRGEMHRAFRHSDRGHHSDRGRHGDMTMAD